MSKKKKKIDKIDKISPVDRSSLVVRGLGPCSADEEFNPWSGN